MNTTLTACSVGLAVRPELATWDDLAHLESNATAGYGAFYPFAVELIAPPIGKKADICNGRNRPYMEVIDGRLQFEWADEPNSIPKSSRPLLLRTNIDRRVFRL